MLLFLLGLLTFLLILFSLRVPLLLLPLELVVVDQVFIVLLDGVKALVELGEGVGALEGHGAASAALLLLLLVHVEGRPDLVGVTVPDAVVVP